MTNENRGPDTDLQNEISRLERENESLRQQNEELAGALIVTQGSFVDAELRAKRKERMFRITQNLYHDIIRQGSPGEIYRITARTLCEKIGHDRVVMLSAARDGYRTLAHCGYKDFDLVARNFVLPEFAAHITNRELGLVVNAGNAAKFGCDFRSLFETPYFMAVPFGRDNEFMFFIGNQNEDKVKKPRFAQSDVEMYRTLGNLVSIVVKNAELYEGLERTVDERTRRLSETNALLKTEILERTRAEKAAETALRVKNEFLANMSHEIRTPMNAIVVMTGLALSGADGDTKMTEYLHTIRLASNSLLAIINDILDFSKIEAGMMKLESIDFDPRSVLDKIRSVHSHRAKEKGLEFTVDCMESVPRSLNGDPFRLEQVLLNLVSNAVKFTYSGSVRIVVTSRSNGRANGKTRLEFSIRDTGIGIPETEIPRLFKAFEQFDNSITRKYGGTGLGLSISKKLAELMGGEIRVSSSVGAGSDFTLAADFGATGAPPAEQTGCDPDAACSDPAGDAPERPGSLCVDQGTSAQGSARALIVEDNCINQYIASALFESRGIAADIASNGREAVETFAHGEYDVILMDIQMPVMDGYTATKLIRKSEKGRCVPIIAVTAHAIGEELERCIGAGMDDYVTKPIDVDLLFAKLGRWVAKSRNSCEVASPPPAADRKTQARHPRGIDYEKGVQRAGGNESVFTRVIDNFRKEYREIGRQITELVEGGKILEACDLSHSLKGVSGNISAGRLYLTAREVNDALKAGSLEGINGKLRELEEALEEVIDGIEAFEAAGAKDAPEPKRRASEPFEGGAREAAGRMEGLLAGNDVSALRFLDILLEKLACENCSDEAGELDAALRKFDFRRARAALSNIKEKLGI